MVYYAEILIVDDSPDQIYYCTSLLQPQGYHVFAATSAKAARAFLDKRKPNLILLDRNMSDTDGMEICRKIKSNKKIKDIPVIFMTHENDDKTIAQCLELGASDYIKRPFSPHELLARIKTQLKLSAQQHELIAANEELSKFCYSVTHDLKSPFTSIKTIITSLQNELDAELGSQTSEKILYMLNRINAKSTQAELMITRLFEFSKMCNVKPVAVLVHTVEIINDIFNELAEQEKPDRIIHFKCDAIPDIVADETLFRMAMRNLLINALKYSSKKPETNIHVYTVNDPTYYIIKVKDNGAGFDMNYASKIFEVFERLHTEREFPGTGVGLALVNRIMQRHSGKIEAYGEVDVGAEMTLYFPKTVHIKEIREEK